jgi:2-isopropylmalate synthase
MKNQIVIFDTTLRDGEQSPGCTMNLNEKLLLAKQLEKLGVDVIEAGFPAASTGDFEAVKAIAETVTTSSVCGLARALESDISRTWEAIKNAKKPRIHTFIATSDIHLEYKLKMTKDECYKRATDMVRYAKSLCDDVEFSPEDASRSDLDFLVRITEGVIAAGATTVNIPDTVGYTTPDEYYKIIDHLIQNVKGIEDIVISVHCHNDLGMAVANSLAAVSAGARQVECTVNGIGERAGNAALEEVVMALKTREDQYKMTTQINIKEIARSSKLLTSITGIKVQPNKAIVGKNAFSHESGIHQHGMLSNSSTYEIMSPEAIGVKAKTFVLGKHSGKHSFVNHLKELGYILPEDKIGEAFDKFKALADKKKNVYDRDLIAIVMEESIKTADMYTLKSFNINTGTGMTSMATVVLEMDGKAFEEVAMGDGPIDAAYNAIRKVFGVEATLLSYKLDAVTEGMDALGEATVKVESNNNKFRGHGLSTDVIESSIEAYINALNRVIENREDEKNEKQ